MPTTLGTTQICNAALSKIGAQAIVSITDQSNASALACNTQFQLCYLEVSRSAVWNCLMDTAILAEEPQEPLPGVVVPSSVGNWEPATTYAPGDYFTYGGIYYQVLQDYTSTSNFTVDLTQGFFVQTNLPFPASTFPSGDGSAYPSGWANKYALPTDFQLMYTLNNEPANWGFSAAFASTADFQIMGQHLFCDQSQAVIQYVKNVPDTTRFDSLFTNALTLKLASAIATQLRQDGGRLEAQLLQGYEMALRQARTKNSGERQFRRFNPIGTSNFNRARYGGVNGTLYIPKIPDFLAKMFRWFQMGK